MATHSIVWIHLSSSHAHCPDEYSGMGPFEWKEENVLFLNQPSRERSGFNLIVTGHPRGSREVPGTEGHRQGIFKPRN